MTKYKDINDFDMRIRLSAELGSVRDVRIGNARSEIVEFRKAATVLNGGGIAFCFPVLQYFEFGGSSWLVMLAGLSFLTGLFATAFNTWVSAKRYASISHGFSSVAGRMYANELDVEDVQEELDRVSKESKPTIRDWHLLVPMVAVFVGAALIVAALLVHYIIQLST